MQNYLLRYCRETSGFSHKQIAARSGIPAARYHALEAVQGLMTTEESELLGKLFKTEPGYLWQSSLQLESLKTAQDLVYLQKEKIHTLTLAV